MNNVSLSIHEVGDVFVAVVEVIREETRRRKEDQRTGGNGFGGIPHIGVEEGVVGATELRDAEEVLIEEALKRFYAILHCAHLDSAAHAVEGHGDHGVARLPADRAVFCVVDNRPNARLGFDEGLIAIVVVLRHEVVNRRVLIEIVGGVGFTLGGRAVSDVIVGIGNFICSDEFIADVATIVLIIDKHIATTKEGSSPL